MGYIGDNADPAVVGMQWSQQREMCWSRSRKIKFSNQEIDSEN